MFLKNNIFKVIHDREKYLTSATNTTTTFSFLNKTKKSEKKLFIFLTNPRKNSSSTNSAGKIEKCKEMASNTEANSKALVVHEEFNLNTPVEPLDDDDELIKSFPNGIILQNSDENHSKTTSEPNNKQKTAEIKENFRNQKNKKSSLMMSSASSSSHSSESFYMRKNFLKQTSFSLNNKVGSNNNNNNTKLENTSKSLFKFRSKKNTNSLSQIRGKVTNMSKGSFSSTSGTMGGKLDSTRSKSSTRNQEQMRLIKESKAAKILAIVVGGFILCWLPFFSCMSLKPFCHRELYPKVL